MEHPFPSNSDKPFDKKSSATNPTTVKQFNLQFHQLIAAHGFTQSATNDLLTLFRDHTDSLDLPLTSEDKVPFNSKPLKSNTIGTFIKSDVNDFTTNICRHECMVFRGMQLNPRIDKTTGLRRMENCSELLNCMFCHSPRFSKCGHIRCKIKAAKYEACDPFKKGHSLAYRVAMKDVYYRTIIGKLIQLYCLSQMDGFEDILNYDEIRVKKSGKIIDILDGTEFQLQMHNMSVNHKKVKAKWDAKMSSRGELHECSLIVTISYDGVVNFKRKLDSMWPLMTSVANCNPTHRVKLGTGMFATMLHNCGVGTGVEKHMMEEMFVAELKKLETGLIFTIPAHDNFPERNVFLQARLLFCHLDTKALEKCAMLKLSNSSYGCLLCNLQTGSRRPSLNKCVYTGCRLPLHKHHVLRSCGQREFHPQSWDEAFPLRPEYTAEEMSRMYYQGDKLYSDILKAECKDVTLDSTRTTLPANWAELSEPRYSRRRTDKDTVWYHTDPRFAFDKFKREVRFPFPDHRHKVVYKSESTEDYITSGLIASGKREAEELLYAAGKKRPKKPKDFSYNGAHGVSPLIAELSSFEVANLCPDAMHYMLNQSNYLFKLYSRDRGLTDGARQLAVSQGTQVILKYKKLHPRWTLSLNQQDKVDAIVNSLLIPPNYKSDFSFRNPFKHRGHLRARDHMIWLMAFSSFALSFSSMGTEYIAFAAMLGSDLCSLFNPCIGVSELDDIINRIYETRAVFEGLYPESEQVFICHQLVDIANHIRRFGHLRGLMCFASERANGFISQSVTKGGTRYLSTMYNRYVVKENSMLGNFLPDAKDLLYDNCGVYSDLSLRLYGGTSLAVLHESKLNSLFHVVFVFLATQELDNLFELSPFYRLYSAYQFLKDLKQYGRGFYSWISDFDFALSTSGSVSRLCTEYHENSTSSIGLDFTDAVLGHVFSSDLVLISAAIVKTSGNLKVSSSYSSSCLQTIYDMIWFILFLFVFINFNHLF